MKYIAYTILAIVVAGGFFLFRVCVRLGRQQRKNLEAMATAKTFDADFTTPEGAVLCLEEAYRRHDLDAAAACKDFAIEAKLMLHEVGEGLDVDREVVDKTAEVLELAFRNEVQNRWPDFTKSRSFFVQREPYKDDMVVVTEVCHFTDGGTSRQRILVAQTPKGWRVMHPL